MKQHRLVMECRLQRVLTRDEVVHHLNGVRTDNRLENLELTNRQAHGLLHREESRVQQQAPLTEASVRAALSGRTTREAADCLGVHHQTLRNRFDHLLTKRRSPGTQLDESTRQQLQRLASDPQTGIRAAAAALDVTTVTLKAWCDLEGIRWVSAPPGRPSRKT